MLRDRPEGFRRTPRFAAIAREIGLGAGVFGAEGEPWKRQRRMVMAGFDPRHLRAYFPSLVRGLRPARKAAGGAPRRPARPIDLQADLMRFTVDAISGLAFGADVNTLESDDDIIQRHLDKIFPAMFRRLFAPFPTWRWYRTRADRELDASVVKVNAAIDGFVAAARQSASMPTRRAAPRPANLLEAMIVAADDPGSGITDGEVSGNVHDDAARRRGHDRQHAWPGRSGCCSRHPEALARARGRDRRRRRRSGDLDARALPPRCTGSKPAPTRRCASSRSRPSLTLQALRDTTVADIRVPGGDAGLLATCAAIRCARHYFARAAEFDPQRWLEPEQRPGRDLGQPGLDAVRRRTAGLPRPAPGDAGDEDGAGDADRPLRHRARRHARAAASPTSGCRSRWARPAWRCGLRPRPARRPSRARRQRLLAVGDQVLDRFEADREAHQRARPGAGSCGMIS